MQAFRRSTASAIRNVAAVQQRGYANAPAYAETINNLRINADTKVIFQGFTGKQGTYVYFRTGVVSYMMLTLHSVFPQFPRRASHCLRYFHPLTFRYLSRSMFAIKWTM